MKRDEIEKKLITLRIVKKNLSKLNTACAYGYTREVTNLISLNYQIDGEDENDARESKERVWSVIYSMQILLYE